MVELTRSGLVCSGSADDLQRLRTQFDRGHCIRWPRLLESGLLALIQRQIDNAEFEHFVHDGIGLERCMAHNTALSLLHFLTNDPRLFQLVQHVTGCGRIGCYTGRVYRMSPGRGHYDSWHTDMAEHHMIAMSINLGTGIYDGGLLQLREAGSKEVLSEVANTGPGDAILFRIADHLEHRVTHVVGTVSKTAFAGWFNAGPEFLSLLAPRVKEHTPDAWR